MSSSDFSTFLYGISSKPLHVLDAAIPKSKYTFLDLSEQNAKLNTINLFSSEDLENYINQYLYKKNALVAYGGYLEHRKIYQRSTHFNKLVPETERNIHLGVDFWSPVDTLVYAPLEGMVHSFKDNTNYGDYGPTIILKHKVKSVQFFTLYGHLSLTSLDNLVVGQTFKQGDQIATLGDAKVNGDYPPHLHFQIIKDIQDFVGDYPGVCSKLELSFYKDNCPDPNLLLKMDR